MFNRRTFLQLLAALTSGIMVRGASAQAMPGGSTSPVATETDALGAVLPRRKFGRTGVDVTMLGLGGAHVAMQNERDAQATIENAIESGVRYFDTANNYKGSEDYYGRFLIPKFRQHIFLTTKSDAVEAARVREHLDESFRRLKTDVIDLWQIHGIMTKEDVDKRLANGVLDVFLEAKEKGRVRHIGFTGHAHPDTHRHMLALMGERKDPLETCLMPINVLDQSYLSFIDNVLPVLAERKFGIVAMKSLGSGSFLKPAKFEKTPGEVTLVPDRVSVRDAVHFVWSLPVSVMISGTTKPEQIKEMAEFARGFVAMDQKQRRALVDRAADCAGTTLENYKAKA